MALALVMQELDDVMIPFNAKIQEFIIIDEKKKKHSETTKKGQEPWVIYRDIWLKKLYEFPDAYPSYNAKISHIAVMWSICKKSIASRRIEQLKLQQQ